MACLALLHFCHCHAKNILQLIHWSKEEDRYVRLTPQPEIKPSWAGPKSARCAPTWRCVFTVGWHREFCGCSLATVGKAMQDGGRVHIGSLRTFPSFCCEPKTYLKIKKERERERGRKIIPLTLFSQQSNNFGHKWSALNFDIFHYMKLIPIQSESPSCPMWVSVPPYLTLSCIPSPTEGARRQLTCLPWGKWLKVVCISAFYPY